MGVNVKNLTILLLTMAATLAALSKGLTAGWEDAFPPLKHAAWEEECGACHMAFTPGMLPARSWKVMMRELRNHFGEDADLEPELSEAIDAFLITNAADNPNATDVMRRIARGVPANATPQRITTGAMFRYYHDEVPASIWKRQQITLPSNCQACHSRANKGRYMEREIKIPKE